LIVSTEDAARRLGVDPSRIRAMVTSGALEGRKIGGRWIIEDTAIDERLARTTRHGRPLSIRSAWGLLWAADDRATPWLQPRERTRAKQRAREWPIQQWPWATQHRAHQRNLRAHPSVLDAIRNDPRSVRTGSSAQGLPIDLIAPGDAEIYLHADHTNAFITEYGLIKSQQPNVAIRTPPAELWLFTTSDAPWPVVAVDLLEANDDRSTRSAINLANQMRHP
jgi:Helix-turn-helix domain